MTDLDVAEIDAIAAYHEYQNKKCQELFDKWQAAQIRYQQLKLKGDPDYEKNLRTHKKLVSYG